MQCAYQIQPYVPDIQIVSYPVDVSSIIGDQGIVGFTSGTGTGSGRHRTLDWQFASTPVEKDDSVSVPEPASILGLLGLGILGTGSLLRRSLWFTSGDG